MPKRIPPMLSKNFAKLLTSQSAQNSEQTTELLSDDDLNKKVLATTAFLQGER